MQTQIMNFNIFVTFLSDASLIHYHANTGTDYCDRH